MKTVGEILFEARQRKKLTIDDVHKFIKIHPKFITALESGDYSVFSNKVHAKGFLKVYSDLLDLNVEQMLAFWRREYEPEFEKVSKEKEGFKLRSLEMERFAVTPTFIFGFLVFALILGFFGYLFFQYKSYSSSPILEIYSPKDNAVVISDILDVTGKTERDSVLFINSQNVVLNTDGGFATSIKLQEGINALSFRAVNKLGKETEKTLTIIYRPTPVIGAGVSEASR